VFDYPSLSAIAGFIDNKLAAQQPQKEDEGRRALAPLHPAARMPPPAAAAVSPLTPPTAAPLLIVSALYGRFPDVSVAAAVADGMFTHGSNGLLCDVISTVPIERYDVETMLTAELPSRFGGFLAAVQVSQHTWVSLTRLQQVLAL
jgi:hypothetical protein